MSRHYHWIIVALTILNQAVMVGIPLYCFSIFSVPWIEKFDVSLGQLMIAVFGLQLMNSMISPFLGPKLDKISLRPPIVLGFLLYSGGLGILAIANAYWQVILVFAILFPFSVIMSGTFASQLLLNRWFSTNKGLAIGISATGTSLGGMIFPLLIASMLSSYSLTSILISLALFSLLVMAPLNFFTLRINPPSLTPGGTEAKEAGSTTHTWTTTALIATRSFWIPLLLLIPVMAAFTTIQFNLGNYLKGLDYPASFTGQIIALTSFMMILGKLLYGKLADNIDHRYLMLFMALMQITMLLILIAEPDETLILSAAVLLGISGGGLIPLMAVVYASRFDTTSFGRVMGLATFFLVIQSLGSLYAGWMYDLFGNYNIAFTSFAGLIIPGIILLKWLPPPLARAA